MMVVPLQAARNCFRGAPVWKGENGVVKECPALIASCVILTGRMFNGSCSVLRLFADVTGGGDPGSALSSGTETPADRMGMSWLCNSLESFHCPFQCHFMARSPVCSAIQ